VFLVGDDPVRLGLASSQASRSPAIFNADSSVDAAYETIGRERALPTGDSVSTIC
jgi:hypothetical protein